MTSLWCIATGHRWQGWTPLGYRDRRWSLVNVCRYCGKAVYR